MTLQAFLEYERQWPRYLRIAYYKHKTKEAIFHGWDEDYKFWLKALEAVL